MKPKIWDWIRGFYKVYLEDSCLKRQIASLKGCKEHCSYFLPDGKKGWDVIFPAHHYDKIAALVGLPLKQKNSNRVANGIKLGAAAIIENRLAIKKGCGIYNNQNSPEAF
jgi:hypothetical protein